MSDRPTIAEASSSARRCLPPCDAFVFIERRGSNAYRCEKCGRRFIVPPPVALVLLALSALPLVGILWTAPFMWPLMMGLASVPLGAVAYGLHVRRVHPLVDAETAELLRRGLPVAHRWVQKEPE